MNAEGLNKRLEELNRYVEVNPTDMDAWLEMKYILEQLGRKREVNNCLVKINMLRKVKYEKELRIEMYDRFLKRNPNDVRTLYDKAVEIFLEPERYEEALDCFQGIVKIRPNHLGSWKNMSVVLRLMGRVEDAEACEQKFFSLFKEGERRLKEGIAQDDL